MIGQLLAETHDRGSIDSGAAPSGVLPGEGSESDIDDGADRR